MMSPGSLLSESGGDSASESGSENGRRSQSPVQRIDVEQNGSRKRRRLSPAGSEPEETVPSRVLTKTVSRITKAKQIPQRVEEVPTSIEASIKGEKMSFAAIGVDPWLVASLSNMAIKHPTGIQKGCIPEILKGRDCIGGSRTGSGKTVAFAVPILQKWAQDPVGIFAVVLTPTR